MTAKTDILIAGGGIMGCAAACFLSRALAGRGPGRARICVVEPDPSHARSSTALSVASIRQQFTTEINVKISRYGIDFIKSCESDGNHGMGAMGFRENGYLLLAGTDSGAEGLIRAQAMQRRLGAGTELLSPEGLAQKFPWLNTDDVVLASFGGRDEGWFDNMGLLAAFRDEARRSGVEFLRDRVTALHGRAGRVQGVTLASGGDLAVGTVVNAAGTQAAALLHGLDEDIPVEPRKRTVFMIDAPNLRAPDAPLTVCHSGFYLRPEHQHWLCAIVPENDGPADPDDFEPDLAAFERDLWPRLYVRAPGFDAVKVLSAWAGHYAYNRLDQNAIVGAHPNWRNLFLMNGFSGHGLQQAPAMGRGISELITTGAYQTLDLSDLCVERVLAGKPFAEANII